MNDSGVMWHHQPNTKHSANAVERHINITTWPQTNETFRWCDVRHSFIRPEGITQRCCMTYESSALVMSSAHVVFSQKTHPIIKVLGQRVNENDLADGSGSVQTDGGVEMTVPEHRSTHQSDEQRHDENRQESDEPAQESHTRAVHQITNVPTTWTQTFTQSFITRIYRKSFTKKNLIISKRMISWQRVNVFCSLKNTRSTF